MNNRTGLYIVALVVCIFIGFGVYQFQQNYEYYEEDTNTGFSIEAKRNPYLAAELFLQDNGVETYSGINTLDFKQIDPAATILLIDANSALSSPAQVDEIIDWVQEGGYLITSVRENNDRDDSLFARLGVAVEVDDDYSYEKESFEETLDQILKDSEEIMDESDKTRYEQLTSPLILSFENTKDKLSVRFPKHKHLHWSESGIYDELVYAAENEYGYHFLQFAYGEGYITILSKIEIWNSYQIGNDDNAYLLALLANQDSPFYIIYDLNIPSLFQLLKEYASELLLTIMLITALWIWKSSIRLGTIKSPPIPSYRAFSDHIKAMAEFQMSEGNQQVLLNSLKDSVFDKVRVREPKIDHYTLSQQAEVISHYCHYKQNIISKWLRQFDEETTNQSTFLQQVQIAYSIRKQL